jgi:DHA3 family tetracycline resistance protein-like MFS transporter
MRHRTFPALWGWPPVVWFGVIEAGITLTNLLGTEAVRRRVDTSSHRSAAITLGAIDGLAMLCVLAFAVAGQFALALAVYFLFTTATGPRASLEQVWMNQNLDPAVRATVFSLGARSARWPGSPAAPSWALSPWPTPPDPR